MWRLEVTQKFAKQQLNSMGIKKQQQKVDLSEYEKQFVGFYSRLFSDFRWEGIFMFHSVHYQDNIYS